MATVMPSTPKHVVHVLPEGALWKVTLPGMVVPMGLFATRADAIARAHEFARRHADGCVVVHAADGSIEATSSSDF